MREVRPRVTLMVDKGGRIGAQTLNHHVVRPRDGIQEWAWVTPEGWSAKFLAQDLAKTSGKSLPISESWFSPL